MLIHSKTTNKCHNRFLYNMNSMTLKKSMKTQKRNILLLYNKKKNLKKICKIRNNNKMIFKDLVISNRNNYLINRISLNKNK